MKFILANWQLEMDWEGLTLTPLDNAPTLTAVDAQADGEAPSAFDSGEGECHGWT